MFGKQDPYLIIKYRNEVHKTRVIEEGGKNPVWNEKFVFHIASISDDFNIEIRDDDVFGSKPIADCVIKASSFCINGGVRDWFTVNYQE